MTKTKAKPATHTAGPWHCQPEADLHKVGVYAGDGDETIICDVTDEDLTHDLEVEANARLISAAPDLLAALKQIVADWESVDERTQVPDEINEDSHWDAARAAIAKAK